MNTHSATGPNEILKTLPKRVIPEAARRRLNTLSEEMDQLLFLDDTRELAVDRKTLIRIVNNEALVPTILRDIALAETSKHLGRRLKEVGKGRRIPWREGEKYGLPIHPLAATDLREWGINEKTSTDELAAILKAKVPKISSFWMNDNPKELADSIVQRLMVNRTVWDCVVANLGWWAAITLLGGFIIFLILVGSGVPWPWALLIAGIYQSFATAYFIGQCLANPNYHP